MTGNGIYRSSNTSVLAVGALDAPRIVTSAEFDERLQSTYDRVGLRPGVLERLVFTPRQQHGPSSVSS